MTPPVSVGWQHDLPDADQRRIRELISEATTADGIAPVGDQVLRELGQQRTRHLVAVEDGTLQAYLNLAPPGEEAPPIAELVVRPGARRRGIGAQLIRTALSEGGTDTRVWAHGNLEPARATAASLGLVVARELLQMRRSLADLPSTPALPGVTLRTYTGPADDAELLRVNNAAFSWHPEQSGWTVADVAERRSEPWFDPAGLFLAFDDRTAELLGFHWTKRHSADLGEVYVVGVDPAAQGRGLGAALTLVGLHHLAERLSGAGRQPAVMLYVEADNTAAVKTYRRLGFEVANTDVAYASGTPAHL
ncbi:mycothiol synthase [Mycobacterium sp. smrl_JER01]|uniref:mycothiol synthase n=1 Tax=Mycobacterium sp. smrl_JER01 TaxID=3402633 RepID=UPI003AC294A8